MKKLLVKISVAVMLIGGFAIVPHVAQKSHVADPGGGVQPTPTSIVAPTDPTV